MAELADTTGSVQVQQLLELLAVVSSYADQDSAVQGAVERAAQAFEAEVAAVVIDDRVLASIGFPADTVPHADIVAIARRERTSIEVPGAGLCLALSEGWGRTRLVLARWGDGFSVEERGIVRGMARLLELTLAMLRTLQTEHAMRRRSERQAARNAELLATLRERQRLLEHLFDIQRAISRRRPLEQILERVTGAAQDLLGADVVGLWLRDALEPDKVRLVAGIGFRADPARFPVAAAGAVLNDNLMVCDGHSELSPMIAQLIGGKLGASMAAPVHDSGTVAGTLLIGSYGTDRSYTSPEIQTLRAFAEHVSLALTDANTVDRMHQAFHDSLTGLASRGLFLDRLTQQLANPEPIALLFVDLDRFKVINDTLGHAAGDALLIATAQLLRAQLRETDTAARFGGDEFAVLLSGVSTRAAAVSVVERILRSLDQPLFIAGQCLQVNASIGIALSTPGTSDPADLMHRADIAMYQAKRDGRGHYAVFDDDMLLTFAEQSNSDH